MSDFLFTIFIVVILFSVFRRYIFFAILRAVSKRLYDHARQFNAGQQQATSRSNPAPGKVSVEGAENQRRSKLDDKGDYVDFEEVKD